MLKMGGLHKSAMEMVAANTSTLTLVINWGFP